MIWSLSWLTKDDPPIFNNVKFHSLWQAFKYWCWFKLHGQWASLHRFKGPTLAEALERINRESEETNG